MSEALHRKIVAFLEAELGRDEHRQAIRLELSSAQQGFRGDPLRTWEREEDPALFEAGHAAGIASEILRHADEYAASFGPGNHRFVVRTEQFLGGRAKMAFRIQTVDEEESTGGEDAPTEKGLIAQLMRHNEILLRTHLQGSTAATATLARRLDANEGYIGKLLTERVKQFDELEASRGQQQERDLASMKQISRDARIDKGFEQGLKLLPAVVNRVVGSKVMVEKESPRDMMINNLASSLEPEQIAALMQTLKPQQQIILIELFETAKKAAAAQAKDAVPPESGNVNGSRVEHRES